MRLTRITRLRGHRVFRDLAWPPELHPFGRFNLVYGWNGSGKTTLSSLLSLVEKRTALSEGELELEFDETLKVSGKDLSTKPLPPVRVFHQAFIDATFRSAGSGIAPIYFLGEDSVEKQKQVEKLENDRALALDAQQAARSERARADLALDDFCREKAKLIKEVLTSANSAGYNNYDKRRFKQAIEPLAGEGVKLLAEDEKASLRKQKDATPKSRIERTSVPPLDLAKLESEVEQLVTQSVVAQTLEELATDTELASWVQHGLALHSGARQSATCRFCQHPLSTERRSTLEAHFNDAFAAFQGRLDALAERLLATRESLSSLKLPEPSRFYEHLLGDATAASDALRASATLAIAVVDALRTRVKIKRENPFVALDAERAARAPIDLVAAARALHAVVDAHNRTSDDFQRSVKEACEKLERGYLAEFHGEYEALAAAARAAAESLAAATETPAELQAEIDDLERALIEHRRPADELNEELRTYLGRDELRFQVEGAGYALTRNGRPVMQVSEGERTAIAFLYFLKSLEDKGFDRTKGIVVIDDPVSNLDANALFTAFGYMKERTKDCGQLFLFTHSFPFFRLVKNWFHDLPGQRSEYPARQPARFFMLRSQRHADGSRASQLGPLDALLREHASEYPYLFKRVYLEAHRVSVDSLEQHYGLPHVARRLLEAFLAFRFPDVTGDLSARLDRVQFDAKKKVRILRLLDTYAGSVPDADHDLSLLAEVRPVLLDVLALMEAVDKEHYQGLERLVAPPTVAER